ncbi:MAG: tetratricopeptide repeat protein, partial [bacterium]|nr:tetratricopeptide repeat protein [bacterium]
KNLGDGYIALFETAGACVSCAVELGRSLADIALPGGIAADSSAENGLGAAETFLVRIALHGGELRPSGSEYFGPALNRVSRIGQVISGGQVVCSGVVAAVLGGRLPDGAKLDDLGEHHLRDLAEPEHLYQLDHPGFAQHEFPSLSTLNNRPNNLVKQPNRFIGREHELQELGALLAGEQNLITIIAPGGYGKSRLAAQLCANLLHRFERGCFMAYLAPVRDSIDVPQAIASALGYQFSAGRTPEQQLCDYLRAKELLLCLDNMEHLMERAPLVAEILRAAPQVKIVVTSREPLHLQNETIYRLDPLPVSATHDELYSEAARLFVDRAALVNQGFALSADSAPLVQQICERLSGIPLAIELAAAWMDSFTLGELRDELSHQLELESRKSDLPARHQSLKACLDWSWNLLGAPQQEMLMRLSVFRGGFFSEAAGSVLNMKGMALRAALAKLCDKSWLYTREVDGQTRFFLRDMLAHEYAFAKLEETRGAVDSLYESAVCVHAAYYAALAGREGPRLSGGGTPDGGAAQKLAQRAWQLELGNVNEALDSAMQRGEPAWLLPIAEHLQRHLDLTSQSFTQRDRYTQVLAAVEGLGQADLQAGAQRGLGRAHWQLGNYSAALALLEQALALSRETGNRGGEANALNNIGIVERMQGNYSEARALFEQSLRIVRELGNRSGEAYVLSNIGNLEYFQGNQSAARALTEQALALRREVGDRDGEGACLNNLGIVEYFQGNHSAARALYEQSLRIVRETGHRQFEANALGNLGVVERMQGNYSAAWALFEQSLALFRERGDRSGEANVLGNLGVVEQLQGNCGAARALYEHSLQIFRELGNRQFEAGALNNLGTVEYKQGNHSAARALYEQALSLSRELGDKFNIAISCACAGAVLAALGRPREAALFMYGAQHCA